MLGHKTYLEIANVGAFLKKRRDIMQRESLAFVFLVNPGSAEFELDDALGCFFRQHFKRHELEDAAVLVLFLGLGTAGNVLGINQVPLRPAGLELRQADLSLCGSTGCAACRAWRERKSVPRVRVEVGDCAYVRVPSPFATHVCCRV